MILEYTLIPLLVGLITGAIFGVSKKLWFTIWIAAICLLIYSLGTSSYESTWTWWMYLVGIVMTNIGFILGEIVAKEVLRK